MNFLFVIFLLLNGLIATPIPGFNLNFLRNDAQRLKHYEQIVAKLEQKANSASTTQELHKIIEAISSKQLKIQKIRTMNPVLAAQEFDNLLQGSKRLIENLPGTTPGYIQQMIDELKRIGPSDMAAAINQHRLISDSVITLQRNLETRVLERVDRPVPVLHAQEDTRSLAESNSVLHAQEETRSLAESNSVVPQEDPGSLVESAMDALSIPYEQLMGKVKELSNRYLKSEKDVQMPQDPVRLVQRFPVHSVSVPTDHFDGILKPAEDIAKIEEKTQHFNSMMLNPNLKSLAANLPSHYIPEVLDYDGLLKLGSNLIAILRKRKTINLAIFEREFAKLERTSRDDPKAARSQLDHIWYYFRSTLKLENVKASTKFIFWDKIVSFLNNELVSLSDGGSEYEFQVLDRIIEKTVTRRRENSNLQKLREFDSLGEEAIDLFRKLPTIEARDLVLEILDTDSDRIEDVKDLVYDLRNYAFRIRLVHEVISPPPNRQTLFQLLNQSPGYSVRSLKSLPADMPPHYRREVIDFDGILQLGAILKAFLKNEKNAYLPFFEPMIDNLNRMSRSNPIAARSELDKIWHTLRATIELE